MAVPTWTDNSTPVTAANLQSMTNADATEAATNAALGGSASWVDNLNRIRAAISLIAAGNTTTGMATLLTSAVQMLPLSQKGAVGGVASLSAQALLQGSGAAGTPTLSNTPTGSTVTLLSGSTNARGTIQVVVSGGGPAIAAGTRVCTVTFGGGALGATPYVLFGGGESATGTIIPNWSYQSKSATSFDLIYGGSSVTGYTVLCDYLVVA